MNRKIVIISVVLLIFNLALFATDEVQEVPWSLRNNRFYQQSLRLNNLARLAFMEGDYVASYEYAEEAVRYSYLSDEKE